jgi:hypothetical protein
MSAMVGGALMGADQGTTITQDPEGFQTLIRLNLALLCLRLQTQAKYLAPDRLTGVRIPFTILVAWLSLPCYLNSNITLTCHPSFDASQR